jgi:hypothetical protein
MQPPRSNAAQPSSVSNSETINVPAVKLDRASAVGWLVLGSAVLKIERRARGDIRVQFNIESQLVIVHLRWLQQTTDLQSPLTLLLLCL